MIGPRQFYLLFASAAFVASEPLVAQSLGNTSR